MSLACRVCGATAVPRGTGLLGCPDCGLAWREEPYFGKPVYSAGSEPAIYRSGKEKIFFNGLSRLGRSLPRKGLLLDVGCAGGELLKAASARGWRGEGVEIDAGLARRASEAGFTVHADPVEKAGLEKEAYDAATAFEVFSQMADPAAAAAALRAVLKPGGDTQFQLRPLQSARSAGARRVPRGEDTQLPPDGGGPVPHRRLAGRVSDEAP